METHEVGPTLGTPFRFADLPSAPTRPSGPTLGGKGDVPEGSRGQPLNLEIPPLFLDIQGSRADPTDFSSTPESFVVSTEGRAVTSVN